MRYRQERILRKREWVVNKGEKAWEIGGTHHSLFFGPSWNESCNVSGTCKRNSLSSAPSSRTWISTLSRPANSALIRSQNACFIKSEWWMSISRPTTTTYCGCHHIRRQFHQLTKKHHKNEITTTEVEMQTHCSSEILAFGCDSTFIPFLRFLTWLELEWLWNGFFLGRIKFGWGWSL